MFIQAFVMNPLRHDAANAHRANAFMKLRHFASLAFVGWLPDFMLEQW
jgi:hypothetical protein